MSDVIEKMAVETRSRCTMTRENARYVARGNASILIEDMRKPSLSMLAAGADAWREDRTRRTTTLWEAMLNAYAKSRGIE